MPIPLFFVGASLVIFVLWEAFETIVLPRRVTRRARLTSLFYHFTWKFWRAVTRSLPERRRESLLSVYGPLSLLLLLTLWACTLVTSFGLMYWALESLSNGENTFSAYLYFSGTTFFTLGLGDLKPLSAVARFLAAIEAGTGFGFLALVIGYLPALNQSFSRREVSISLLDSRAGSPPSAAEMLQRHSNGDGMESIRQVLHHWERWSAELLESHLSYPVLAYFRSHHNNQSWLAALTAILDTSAFVMACVEGGCRRQARQTFAMARHAVVDICIVFGLEPRRTTPERLPSEALADLRSSLMAAGLQLLEGDEADRTLAGLRNMYEPHLFALSTHFGLALPAWIPEPGGVDNWQADLQRDAFEETEDAASRMKPKKHF